MSVERRRGTHVPRATGGLPAQDPEALDVVWGAEAIAKTIRRPTRAVYHLLQKDLLPARKVGANWVASRAALLRYFSGEAA